jgi:antirestriction protein
MINMTTRTDTLVRVYIANLGKYNEGYLVGDWIGLPATEEEIEALFVRVGLGSYQDGEYVHGIEVDGVTYEEFSIHDHETDLAGLDIGEYSNLRELNQQIEALTELDHHSLEIVQAACEYFGYEPSEVIDRVDDFLLFPDIHDEYDLGYFLIEESGLYDLSGLGKLAGYLDYEAYGRDVHIEANGGFTVYGFIEEVR